MYPILEINIRKLEENLDYIKLKLEKENIFLTGVLKGCGCLKEIVDMYKLKGLHSIASSRVKHLEEIKENDCKIPTMLLRIPMLSEIEDVIKYADISLNSELDTLKALEIEAKKQDKKHSIILMFDLGDLREGCFELSELLLQAEYVEKSSHLHLLGVSTNLSCYGSILPSEENIDRLVSIAEEIESKIGRELELISGGATTTLPLIDQGVLNKRINHLRIGEAILNNKDLPEYFNVHYPLHDDVFILKAQIVEIKNKPSYPIGDMLVDAFGNKPEYIDKGIQKRAILAIGNFDVGFYNKLIPVDEDIELIGASSDHLIISIKEDSDYKIGSVVEFEMYYPPMLYMTRRRLVHKKFIYD